MPLIELIPKTYVPAFSIRANYLPLSPIQAAAILDISVTLQLDPPNQFSFRINDPALALIDQDDGTFTEGSRIEIALGYVGTTQQVIVGEIAALDADFPSSGAATLDVQGFDLLHRLTRGTCYRTFSGSSPDTGMADSDIVSQIAREMKLTPSVDKTGTSTKPRVQVNETSLTFIERLAGAQGFYTWVDGETLYFKQSRPPANKVLLEWHKNLLSFSPRLSITGQVNAVEVRGRDQNQQQAFCVQVERTDSGDLSTSGAQQVSQGSGGQSQITITDAPVYSASEAEAYAESFLSNQQQTLITGNGTAVGNTDIQVGTLLTLRGIGRRFNRTYMTKQVKHTFSGSGFQTSFEVQMTS
jgi:phage protein D